MNEISQLIEQMAELIRQQYNIQIPITDIDQVVEKIGGKVVEDPTLDYISDAYIRKTGENTFEIAISPDQTETHRNIKIAKRLGDLFLHMGFHTTLDKWTAQIDSIPYVLEDHKKQYQSLAFALAFLMPKEEFDQVLRKFLVGENTNIRKTAEYFHVPITAVEERGISLGCLKW